MVEYDVEKLMGLTGDTGIEHLLIEDDSSLQHQFTIKFSENILKELKANPRNRKNYTQSAFWSAPKPLRLGVKEHYDGNVIEAIDASLSYSPFKLGDIQIESYSSLKSLNFILKKLDDLALKFESGDIKEPANQIKSALKLSRKQKKDGLSFSQMYNAFLELHEDSLKQKNVFLPTLEELTNLPDETCVIPNALSKELSLELADYIEEELSKGPEHLDKFTLLGFFRSNYGVRKDIRRRTRAIYDRNVDLAVDDALKNAQIDFYGIKIKNYKNLVYVRKLPKILDSMLEFYVNCDPKKITKKDWESKISNSTVMANLGLDFDKTYEIFIKYHSDKIKKTGKEIITLDKFKYIEARRPLHKALLTAIKKCKDDPRKLHHSKVGVWSHHIFRKYMKQIYPESQTSELHSHYMKELALFFEEKASEIEKIAGYKMDIDMVTEYCSTSRRSKPVTLDEHKKRMYDWIIEHAANPSILAPTRMCDNRDNFSDKLRKKRQATHNYFSTHGGYRKNIEKILDERGTEITELTQKTISIGDIYSDLDKSRRGLGKKRKKSSKKHKKIVLDDTLTGKTKDHVNYIGNLISDPEFDLSRLRSINIIGSCNASVQDKLIARAQANAAQRVDGGYKAFLQYVLDEYQDKIQASRGKVLELGDISDWYNKNS